VLSRAGIEIEFALDDSPLDQVVRSLDDNGLDGQVEDYNHQVRDHWKVTTDSSCGYELVSPILTESTVRSVTPAMRSVANAGGYTTSDCGLHVHIELPLAARHIDAGQEVAALYHDAYDLISPLFSDNRLNNTYARFVEDRDDWLSCILNERYYAVNLRAIGRQGTVEFRQHQGTLSARRAYAWLNLCDALTIEGVNGGGVDSLRKRLRYAAPIEVSNELSAAGVLL
jgi:hypothetical protein